MIKQLVSVELVCSTAEILATATEAAYASNEDSISHTSGNDMDEDFKAWEEDE